MRTVTPERQQLKEQAQRLARRGLSGAAIARQLGVPERTVQDWLSRNNVCNKAGAIPAGIAADKMAVHYSSAAAEWTTP